MLVLCMTCDSAGGMQDPVRAVCAQQLTALSSSLLVGIMVQHQELDNNNQSL
jgi:hypothetical protein